MLFALTTGALFTVVFAIVVLSIEWLIQEARF